MDGKEHSLFEAYLHRQKEKHEILEKHVVCVPLFLKTA
jgi:hypothetical protein